MFEKQKSPCAVMVSYGRGQKNGPVYICKNYNDALEYLQKDYENELAKNMACGNKCKGELSADGTEAKIINRKSGNKVDTTTWELRWNFWQQRPFKKDNRATESQPCAVVESYSWDHTEAPVFIYDTYEEAVAGLRESYKNEVAEDLACGNKNERNISSDGTAAKIINYRRIGNVVDTTTWELRRNVVYLT